MNSPNDPDPGRFVMGMLWFAGWWLVLALWLVVKVYCWVHPPSEWEYTMGGDL